MTNIEIKNVLLEHGVNYLYHCNTVETSLSFLKSGGLLSREQCLKMNLPQTPQVTDEIDKKYNIFNDIFFDSIEIQKKTGISYYGPVLFVYDINVLDLIDNEKIRVTRKNPINWISLDTESNRYFTDIDTLFFAMILTTLVNILQLQIIMSHYRLNI